MDLPKNPFKAALAARKQQIGLWSTIPGGWVAEGLAGCGFDWLLIDTEHSTLSPDGVQQMLQAVAPYPTHAVVRPGSADTVEIKRLLDTGAQSLLIPQVQSAAEARDCVAAVRYPPNGIRGVSGLTRSSRWGAIAGYTAAADAEICLLVQVETVAALAEIEAICAVDGVDGIFIGPADLAASMGYPGQTGHPAVRTQVLEAVRRITAAGKPAGVLTRDQAFNAELIAAGTIFTAVEIDMGILLQGARSLAQSWKG
jgi:4-hydroxy-2-oxoheptanedioate aldolase